MVYRVYVEKKQGFQHEANSLLQEVRDLLEIKSVENIRVINRYDVEDIEKSLFDYSVKTVFSEPQMDTASDVVDLDGAKVFAVEYLPGQFDQRADSASQCIQLISQKERPTVKTAKVYAVYGNVTDAELLAIKKFVINPVESREAELKTYETLKIEQPVPSEVEVLEGFIDLDREGLEQFVSKYALAMDGDDIAFCQKYFISEKRNPTLTEIRMIDTYWSDHCRHTTFLTTIDGITFEDEEIEKTYQEYLDARKELSRTKPINLMDIGTLAAKLLKKRGILTGLDESEEINACTVKIKVKVNGEDQDWLLLFKNETHNHPTEIEPFGGAATCIGGAIRDPLSGRSYVYAAMRVTGAANPLRPVKETLKGKLPQRKIVTTAAAGYSSYGNQIGLATGQVDEIYHEGYSAKRMEIGAVVAATPQENVRREVPAPTDKVILIGGRTGRDGCGGATGSSKSHTLESLTACGAEVQKGNAPEERKLQRLFRNKDAMLMIKRCNDFGAGGVSVAIGELADGLFINLNAVKKKYDGLDGTELAISESQERMAVVVEEKDVEKFIALAEKENLEASVVATVTEQARLVMTWNDKVIVDISREFLNSNGAEKHVEVKAQSSTCYEKETVSDFTKAYESLADDLNVCSKRGLSERFDSTIGAGTVLMPFGGKYQQTPPQAMVNLVSVEKGHTDTVSYMAWGGNPYVAEKSPYHGAYLAVVESVCKLIATGAEYKDVYLTFQEYFQKLKKDPIRWGQPASALLGAFKAQVELGVAAIGGKDSMSGTFEDIDVPPTLVSFAVTTGQVDEVTSPEFKKAGSKVVVLRPKYQKSGLPETKSLLDNFKVVTELLRSKKALSVYTPTYGGIAEAILKMAIGNQIGFKYDNGACLNDMFKYNYGSFVIELDGDFEVGELLGYTTEEKVISYKETSLDLLKLLKIYEDKLEPVFACNLKTEGVAETFSYSGENKLSCNIKTAKPKVLIPVFPGTNCEFDTAKAFEDAGADAEIYVIKNLTASDVAKSVEEFSSKAKSSQMIFVPGGFSGGDEPDGSGKFITAFFRNGAVKEQVTELLEKRDGLMGGICNGFQALIKLGLVPYGKIIDTDETCPTLTYNNIGRHQSKIVRVRVASTKSPWLSGVKVGDVYNVAISHGEGKFIASDDLIKTLAQNGQIMTQYVDFDNRATMDIQFNPNGSISAIEGILSPDGRVFGKMGHSERKGYGLYKNVIGEYDMRLFESAVSYFTK
ncbi:MAG: phosphoribosylformylglycinamidine synthase [Clostridiales bacterium]|nr:phosphoribosylformylglycinamidine synthase [Clostridiales bacterium]